MSSFAAEIEQFLHTYEELQSAVAGLTDEELRWKPAPDKWSVTEVLVHVSDHLIVVSFRIREILSGSAARLPAFSQDDWVAGQRANEAEAADVLEAFRSLLVYNGQLLRRLPEADWDKTAVNFKGETVSLLSVIRGFVAHARNHLGQIDRIRRAEAGSRSSGSCDLVSREGGR
jgi:hypothetical protein